MSKKRVHELAKELGLENREAVQALQAAGISVKTHSSSVYEEEALAVLNKVKGPQAPAAPARRAGMMIVKRRKDIEAEEAALAAQQEAEQAALAQEQAQQAEQTQQFSDDADIAAAAEAEFVAQDVAAQESSLQHAVSQPEQQPHEAQPSAAVPQSVSEAAPEPQEVAAPPGQTADAAPVPEASAPQRDVKPTVPAHMAGPPRREGGRQTEVRHAAPQAGAPRGDAAAVKPGATTTVAGAPVRPRPASPTSATVVRMIDRDKLLERVPGRRLGGGGGRPDSRPQGARPTGARPAGAGAGAAGAGAPRYGQVTELRVVTDPFGRGREMVAVGRDKKKGVAGAPGAGLPGRGAPPRGGKGRGTGKRDMDMRERAMHPSRLKRKKVSKRTPGNAILTQPKASKRVIKMKESIVVAELAHQLGVKSVDIIRKLMGLGSMVTQNQTVDFDTAALIAAEFEYTVESVAFTENTHLNVPEQEQESTLKPRPPVVTVMGHVDHGKTSLLDAIRKSRVAKGEAGGITQHIGAYQVTVPKKGTVTFLDTPGHAAFTAMRARGAQVTDIVVLVVAADDGLMPQTEEAIKHAQAAGVPIIVAINKIDKPDANPDRVMQELTKFELVSEAWGGETQVVNTSATQGTGIPELLEAILLQAEVLELKANPDRTAIGTVVEAQLDRGRGPVATVLIQQGTLKQGDAVVVGTSSGKVRAMMNDQGRQLKTAGPSMAVEITGLDVVPEAGDNLNAVENSEVAREVAQHRQGIKRSSEMNAGAATNLDDLMKRMEGVGGLELKLVLKADVQGSVEAVKGALTKLTTDEVKVNVIYGGVGAIKESDIMLAAASQGIVLGFGVRPDSNSRLIAEREGVEIRTYNIIYEAVDDVRAAMEGLLKPESREKIVGRAEVRDLFRVSKVGVIGGCRVVEGKAMRSARVRVLRDSVQVYDGRVASLRHFKNDAREVDTGLECGVGVEGYNDLKNGDVIEFYQMEEVARTLGAPSSGNKRPSGGAEAHP